MKDVSIGFKQNKPLVDSLNLEIYSGEIVAIAGPSGIGKTTMLKTIAGLVPPLSGKIEVCGSKIPSLPPRGSLGYIPQRLGLVRHASVYHNVMMGALAGNASRWFPYSTEARRLTLESIELMGINDKIRTPIRKLSGGQQRRVATARTLAQRPSLILADEFLSELDEETMNSVMDSVKNYVKENNATLLVVEHDIARSKILADRLLIMDDGRLNPFITGPIIMEVK
jgi:ABC-type multidrug transport system ATPase subunit